MSDMSVIDYMQIYTLNIPIEYMQDVYSIIDPASYMRFYQDKQKKTKNDKNKDKSTHNEILELQEQLKKERDRSKNLLSLTLIYKQIKSTRYTNSVCPLKLNLLLTFELFITVSHHINKYTLELEEIYKKQESFEPLSNEYRELQDEVQDIFPRMEALREVNAIIISSLKPEILYALTVEYNNFTSEEHAKRCLL